MGCTAANTVEGYKMLVTLVGSAPSSLPPGRFMWVDLQLEASSETARINVIQRHQSSTQRKVCLCGRCMHTSPALPPHTVLAVDRPLGSAAGHGCSSALKSREHGWSGGLRFCWLMSLILPAFFLNALLLPHTPLLPLPSLYLSLSLKHTPELSPSPLHMT